MLEAPRIRPFLIAALGAICLLGAGCTLYGGNPNPNIPPDPYDDCYGKKTDDDGNCEKPEGSS